MDARGLIPSSAYDGRHKQAPGMMHHGSILGSVPAPHHPREPLLPPEPLEKKVLAQEAEMERIVRENKRLAESNVAMRRELLATKKELQTVQTHLGSIHTESDIQIRGLLEKIGKMEADVCACDVVRKELQQAHVEAQSLVTARQEMTAEIQLVTEELHKISSKSQKLPDLQSELDGLKQEHQSLRSTFEYEKGLNINLVERMRGMENNLMSMAGEIDRLRAEIRNAEQRINASSQYGGTYPNAAQASRYVDNQYGPSYVNSSIYVNPGFVYADYSEPYGIGSQALMTGGATSVQAPDSNRSMSSGATGGANTYEGRQAR